MRALLCPCLALGLFGAACAKPSPTGVAIDRKVREPSGLVESAAHPGVYWTHGDSGNGNWLFAIDADGQLLARYRVSNAENIDWEDISRDESGNLWLGDIGNNSSERRDLAVLRIPEPAPAGEPGEVGKVLVDRELSFRYPDQQSYGRTHGDFDAESLLWWADTLWVLSKDRLDHATRLYRFPSLDASEDELVLELVDDFDLGPYLDEEPSEFAGRTTAADLAPDGAHWALLSYDAVYVFATPAPDSAASLLDELVNRVALDPSYVGQIEALAWDARGLLMCNEDRAVFRVEDPLTATRVPASSDAAPAQ
ncbi:hypothetical protein G6O69_16265 [Pseudenhygromyxa sp. WMMC2535]|uniref:hypothetical protein n=1 Tax=Pseudenhygromyxa sp. WMMC2535 TaxID=2712867 RepID=UPI00155238DC|nr:hypothetical protein [Pseudenhygromyxa sp. WMMC2535]NVB39398.1 hypothetical protein [Pseudenhygromyxa sp. WMMC2535]